MEIKGRQRYILEMIYFYGFNTKLICINKDEYNTEFLWHIEVTRDLFEKLYPYILIYIVLLES